MEFLAREYTEVWIPSPLVPLAGFANAARPLASTGMDSLGLGDLEPPPHLVGALRTFDSIVSWYGTRRPEFRRALHAIAPRSKFLQALPPSGCCLHATDFFASQVGAPTGLIARLPMHAPQSRSGCIIHPFSGGKRKNWPLEFYRELADHMPVAVEWCAGPEEELPGAHRFSNLHELAEWIAGARLYIGNDSGITHLAAAVGVTVLALFGPTDPLLWGPRGPNVTVMRSEPIEALPVSEVLAKAQALLSP